jgi:hypothetical protein
MSVQNGAYTRTYSFGNEGDRIVPRFFIESVADEGASAREGRPIFRDQERVELMMPGNTFNVPVEIVNDTHRQRWPEQYKAFKAGQEMAVEGTPLEQWPILKRSQVLELKALNLFTVEHVAGMPDATCQRFMGGMRLRNLAKAYLDDAQAASVLAATTADNERKDAQIADLNLKVEQLTNALSQLHDNFQALRNAPSPVASHIPGLHDPVELAKGAPESGGSSLDSLPELPRRKGGRPPLPRDAEGNIIRQAANG